MPRIVLAVCFVLALAVCSTGQVLAQTQTTVTIQDVLDAPQKWFNQDITLVGEIRNPQQVGEVGRGTYQLCGPRGAAITVRTKDLPGSGEMSGKFEVRGSVSVDAATGQCILWEQEGARQSWPPVAASGTEAAPPKQPDVWNYVLIGGGVVLVVLLIALVSVLMRKPPAQQAVVEPGAAHIGDTVAAPAAPAAAPVAAAGTAAAAETKEYRPAAPPTQEFLGATLSVTEGPDSGKSFSLSKQSTTIGRQEGQDIRLSDATVSREHARILAKDDGGLQLINQSTKGTQVNGEEVESKVLANGDLIQLGGTVLSVKALGAAQPTQEYSPPGAEAPSAPGATQEFLGAQIEVESGPHSGESHVLSKTTTTVGRAENQDIALANDPTVSREHCEIRYQGGEFMLVARPDRTVLVNGQEHVSTPLVDGDEIQIGGTKLRLRKM